MNPKSSVPKARRPRSTWENKRAAGSWEDLPSLEDIPPLSSESPVGRLRPEIEQHRQQSLGPSVGNPEFVRGGFRPHRWALLLWVVYLLLVCFVPDHGLVSTPNPSSSYALGARLGTLFGSLACWFFGAIAWSLFKSSAMTASLVFSFTALLLTGGVGYKFYNNERKIRDMQRLDQVASQFRQMTLRRLQTNQQGSLSLELSQRLAFLQKAKLSTKGLFRQAIQAIVELSEESYKHAQIYDQARLAFEKNGGFQPSALISRKRLRRQMQHVEILAREGRLLFKQFRDFYKHANQRVKRIPGFSPYRRGLLNGLRRRNQAVKKMQDRLLWLEARVALEWWRMLRLLDRQWSTWRAHRRTQRVVFRNRAHTFTYNIHRRILQKLLSERTLLKLRIRRAVRSMLGSRVSP
ncbi:MAG: hypothetical protein EP343_33650 [Deltaproteobacteria bacterium]|nr:MAG: hypothetical protein EP343_33650 [Deltaproteobacteria bacterium]